MSGGHSEPRPAFFAEKANPVTSTKITPFAFARGVIFLFAVGFYCGGDIFGGAGSVDIDIVFEALVGNIHLAEA